MGLDVQGPLGKGHRDGSPSRERFQRVPTHSRPSRGLGGLRPEHDEGGGGDPRGGAQSAEPFAGAPQAAGSFSRPRERRCYWRKVPGLRRDWPQPGPPPPAAPRRPRGCAARAWGRRALRGAGARGSLRPRAMLPPALLWALCGGLWAAAARAGYSEDRCRWRGRYDPPGARRRPGSASSPAERVPPGGRGTGRGGAVAARSAPPVLSPAA